jgi:hypothetical protein
MEDLGSLRDLFENLGGSSRGQRKTRDRARQTPNVANQVQYPEEFYNVVPMISGSPLEKTKMDTIIIATQSPGYSEQSFLTDVAKTVEYFELAEGTYQAVLLKPVHEDGLQQILDSADATSKLREVVKLMNRNTVLFEEDKVRRGKTNKPSGETMHIHATQRVTVTKTSTCTLRIVSVGVASSAFTFTALEYMMNHWLAPDKYVQFVTNGEINRGEFSQFWTSACINQLISAVQFVNLQCYLPFGYYNGTCKKLHKTGQVDATTPPPAVEQADAALRIAE